MALVEIENLHFSYGNHLVLDIEKFQIEKGQRVFMAGPSGSGKTTLLGLIAGVLQPQVGRVEILNQNFSQMSSAGRDRFRGEHLGYIFQMFNLVPYLNVLENVTLPCEMSARRRAKIKGSLQDQALQFLQRLGLGAFAQKNVNQLSVGQQQRVAVARALLGAPELLIADEPTSALDHDHRSRFLELLFELADSQNTTLLFVSHDPTLRDLFSQKINLAQINRAAQTPVSEL